MKVSCIERVNVGEKRKDNIVNKGSYNSQQLKNFKGGQWRFISVDGRKSMWDHSAAPSRTSRGHCGDGVPGDKQ